MTAGERFLAKVARRDANGCHRWMGATNSRGYGAFGVGGKGKVVLAHRWAYEHFVGPIANGLTVDHLCRNKRCVNPGHIDLCVAAENSARASALVVRCRKGHPLPGKPRPPRADGKRSRCFCLKTSGGAR